MTLAGPKGLALVYLKQNLKQTELSEAVARWTLELDRNYTCFKPDYPGCKSLGPPPTSSQHGGTMVDTVKPLYAD